MASGTRQTLYFKYMDVIKRIAEEENIEINGAFFEELFMNDFLSKDKNFKVHLLNYYSKDSDLDFRDCLARLTELMAYNPEYTEYDNIDFVKVVRAAIGDSPWFSETELHNHYTGDYSLDNKHTYVDSAFSVFENAINMVLDNKKFAKENNIEEPWTLKASDKRYNEIINKEEYYSEEGLNSLEIRIKKIRKELNTDLAPGFILDMIIANWDFLWNFKSTYEAIEYCIRLASNISDNPSILKQLRAFTLKDSTEKQASKIMNETFKNEKLHERLLEYFNRIN